MGLSQVCKTNSTFEKSVNIIYYINRLKRKKNVIIPIDAIKAFDKMQHPSIIKTFSNARIEGNFL